MAKSQETSKKKQRPADDEEAATLAAIDAGIRDAKSGQTVSLEEARKRLSKWITESSSRKER
jgi:predicted transcriptional regulator